MAINVRSTDFEFSRGNPDDAIFRRLADGADGVFAGGDGVGVVQRMKKTARNSITTILARSKRTGTAILMRGRDLARFLRDRVVQLELPSKADALVKKKTDLTSKLFTFKGGRAAKVFVGVSLG